MSRPDDIANNFTLFSDYVDWYSSRVRRLNYSTLLPRDTLNKWLYGLFLKLALPVDINQLSWRNYIFSPLNMTIYFRLLVHLHKVGYPGHWLSSIVANIIENTVRTSARPPTTIPLEIEEVNRKEPLRKLEMSPFVPEMSTLATLFQPVLPFTIITSTFPTSEQIARYTFSFASLHVSYEDCAFRNAYSLLFWDSPLLDSILAGLPYPFVDWRRLLAEGSQHDTFMKAILKSPKLPKLRAEGLFLWTTLEWNREKEEVSAWMREDFAQKMMREPKWRVAIVRTDYWGLVTDAGVPNEVVVSKGEKRWG
ncbi:MAG: hypothetical protein Q9191_007371 [Dirinaria sp. TL-2023a]